jgi:hypothetical protein
MDYGVLMETEVVGDPEYIKQHYVVWDIFLRPQWDQVLLEAVDVKSKYAAKLAADLETMANFYRITLF